MKKLIRITNFLLGIISFISIFLFLFISNNFSDKVIVFIFIPLLFISLIAFVCNFYKESKNIKDENEEDIKEKISQYCKLNKADFITLIVEIIIMLLLIFIYNYGILILPTMFYGISLFFKKAIS